MPFLSLLDDQLALGFMPMTSAYSSTVSHVNGDGGDNLINMSGVNDPLVIKGLGGNDTLYGGNASDRIIGGSGDDILHAGLSEGNDTLYGGAGNDIFMFGQPDTFSAYTRDTIVDLHKGDIIDLSGIDADENTEGDQAFTIVDKFTHHAGELRITYDALHGVTRVAMDPTGSAHVSYVDILQGDHHNFIDFVL